MTESGIGRPPQFGIEEIIDRIHNMPYNERRKFLWHRVVPRLSRFLYKFKSLTATDENSIEHIRDILIRSRLWLSSPADFNDPFDMSAEFRADAPVEVKRERIRSLLINNGMKRKVWTKKLPLLVAKPNSYFAEEARKAHEKSRQSTGVFSFGGDPRSILMWSHYANNHEGICLQFEVAKDLKSFARALSVQYTNEYPEVNWFVEFNKGMEKTLLRKHSNWSYEKERRIIHIDRAHQYINFLPEAVQSIILGCRSSESTISKFKEILAERTKIGYPKLHLYRAVEHKSKYKIVIQRLI